MLRKIAKTPTATNGAGTVSIIGSDVRIVGDIITDGEMQIDGKVEGDIACKSLVIGQSAHISGEVSAERVRIHGTVAGKLSADHITIGRTGHVTGDIFHDSLEIETGAQVEGHFLRKGAHTAPPALEAPKPAEPEPVAVKTAKPVPETPLAKPNNGHVAPAEVLGADDDVPATVN